MSEELKERKEALFAARKNGYDRLSAADEKAMAEYCAKYADFLEKGKTERLCARRTVALAEAQGFRPFVRGEKLTAGDKVYRVCVAAENLRGFIFAVFCFSAILAGAEKQG